MICTVGRRSVTAHGCSGEGLYLVRPLTCVWRGLDIGRMERGAGARASREQGPVPAYRMLAIGTAASLAFTALIWLLSGWLADVPHAPDAGASWYYWKLIEPTAASRLTAWGFYLLHQVSFWALIAWAQRMAGRNRPRYSNSLRTVNYLALGVNGFFILLHLVQTHVWYDGLAQDVSIWSALGSVALMLVWVLLMENPRRGLFFGKKIGFPRRLTDAARRYHGYYFAWAIVYTFWYHPMEATSGHLIGFLYMFLLMLQGSLFFTRAHVNRWWTLALEVAVLAHGTLVAIMQGEDMWPMFAFGVRRHLRDHPDARAGLVAAGARPGAGRLRGRRGGGVRAARLGPAERGAAHPPDRLRRRVRPGRHHRRRPRPDPPLRGTDPIGERAVRGLSRGLSDRRPGGVGQTLVAPLQSCR